MAVYSKLWQDQKRIIANKSPSFNNSLCKRFIVKFKSRVADILVRFWIFGFCRNIWICWFDVSMILENLYMYSMSPSRQVLSERKGHCWQSAYNQVLSHFQECISGNEMTHRLTQMKYHFWWTSYSLAGFQTFWNDAPEKNLGTRLTVDFEPGRWNWPRFARPHLASQTMALLGIGSLRLLHIKVVAELCLAAY